MIEFYSTFRTSPSREGMANLMCTKETLLSVLIMAASLYGTPEAHAAVTPPLGAAATYGVLASTYTNTAAGTTINGDVGFTTGPAVAPAGTHTHYGPGAPYAVAGSDQGTALSSLNAQPCTFSFAPGAIDLSTDTTHGVIGVYTPGVYCSSGAMTIGGPLTLNGNGTYIFRPAGALNSTAGAVVTLAGTSACNVFWTPSQATTLGANTTFAGIIIDAAGITVSANTTWTGMGLAFGGTITTDTVTITVPSCVASSSSTSSSVSSTSSSLSSSSTSSSFSSSMSSLSTSSSTSSSIMSSLSSSPSSSSTSSSISRGSIRSSSSMSSSSAPPVVAAVTDPPPPSQPLLMPQTGVDLAAWGLLISGFLVASILSFASRRAEFR